MGTKCAANYPALTPLMFLERTAISYGDRTSIIYGDIQYTWSQTFERCRRLASALNSLQVQPGDVVSVVAPNVPAMYEMHFGVPMVGAILNTLNVRLNASTMASLLKHSGSKVVFADSQYLPLALSSVKLLMEQSFKIPIVIAIDDPLDFGNKLSSTELEYERLLKISDPQFPIRWPTDEWETISLNYTSGTTSRPKGVEYHHRGAYINAIVAASMWGMKDFPVHLWTVPMFHCNGWCLTWTMAAQAGTNVCLRSITAKSAFEAILKHKVTHLSGAPIVLNILASAPINEIKRLPSTVHVLTGGAPPPPSILSRMEDLGFVVTHSYGLTETFGPALYCRWKPEWNALVLEERAVFKSRQGLGTLAVVEAAVMNPKTMEKAPRDGKTIGEVMLRGVAIMKGYWNDEKATNLAFEGGWFHTGDLGVMHSDGYIQLKDRSKDIIISGGENISSIEVESVLYNHPQVLEAAVVARPDEHWGETPCAFVHVTGQLSSESVITHCRERLPHFMVPRSVVFGELPKTSTGKVQKYLLRERAKAMGSLQKSKL
ncbi:hypothetical protein GOP47_0017199 [Adiantum capillus-veneris]|uniref:4-coumarate--CoA ligase n=1 Tax=Adiantum capillus-veneris TaxID=13818 RepID=A0A9D4ZAM7_ADICA|nr:hypothetical protein GOP47_0016783 [Adiantum capillus-veneris]KAI5068854.1 hypothetical protein GOP47_0017199 [Adiantum capillus-veneris]